MGITERFNKEKQEINDLLTNVLHYHEIVRDIKEKSEADKASEAPVIEKEKQE